MVFNEICEKFVFNDAIDLDRPRYRENRVYSEYII